MPQATGRAQSRARAGRSGGATGAVRRAGACISARIPLVGASSERSEEHTSELQSLMRISYAVFCLKQQNHTTLPRTPSYYIKHQRILRQTLTTHHHYT